MEVVRKIIQSIPLVDLKAQYSTIQSEIDSSIQRVFKSGIFIHGTEVRNFEQKFANYIGTSYAVSCANGTDAIEIALQSLGIGNGDEVIVPALTWIATAEAVSSCGGKPVFVDIDPNTYSINPLHIEKSITKKTKAIIPVHLYGHPAEMDDILDIAKQFKLKVIEDCAQAHGAEYKGKKVGTFGDMATFSFYPGKNLGAYGDAGMILTQNQEYAIQAKIITNHGQLRKNEHLIEGRNSRMDELQAAILTVKLKHLENWTKARIKNAELYREHLSNLDLILPVTKEWIRHVFHLYVIRISDRKRIQEKLKEGNIQTSIHYPIALPFMAAYKYLGYKIGDFPVANTCTCQIISLPMYPELCAEEIEYICHMLKINLGLQ